MKRLFSIVLSCCIILSGVGLTAFATTTNNSSITIRIDGNYTASELSAIEAERELMHDDIMKQLLAQNAADQYELFVSIFDAEFNQTYFPITTQSTVPSTVSAPNGGWFHAYNSEVDIMKDYCLANDAKDTHDDMQTSSLAQAIINFATTIISEHWEKAGTIIETIDIARNLMIEAIWSTINVGVDNALIVTTDDKIDLNTTTVISKWRNYPTMTNGLDYYGNVTYGVD